MAATIGVGDLARMVRGAVEKIRANHETLSRLDSATGDGDHGTTMLRAMEAAGKAIDEGGGDIPSLLNAIGWGILSVDGGSTGPLLGSFFMGMGEGAGAGEALDGPAVASLFEAGLAAMRKQSRAQVGDKTMMDALIPAVEALRSAAESGADVEAALRQGAEAAARGAEATRDMRAKFGRAKNLGDRTLGAVDPGARSMAFLFEGFVEGLAAGK